MKIIRIQNIGFLKNISKAYTEGVYADTSQNRKLGRVGMSYKEVKQKEEKEYTFDEKQLELALKNNIVFQVFDNYQDFEFGIDKNILNLI